MITRHSSISIATALGLHVLLVMLVLSGMLEHVQKEIEPPPVIIELIQPKKIEPPPPPPPKPEPKKPEPPKPPKPEPVKPEPPKVVEQRPEPPKPEPAKAVAPTPVAAPTAPEAPPKPTPAPSSPAAEPVSKPAPAAPAPPAKTGVNISASYRASNAEPVYPRWSQKNHEYGTVVLRVLVKSDGTAGSVEIKSSSDYPRLDQSAIQAVKTWRFNPATVDGKSIDEWYEVPIIFKPPNN